MIFTSYVCKYVMYIRKRCTVSVHRNYPQFYTSSNSIRIALFREVHFNTFSCSWLLNGRYYATDKEESKNTYWFAAALRRFSATQQSLRKRALWKKPRNRLQTKNINFSFKLSSCNLLVSKHKNEQNTCICIYTTNNSIHIGY